MGLFSGIMNKIFGHPAAIVATLAKPLAAAVIPEPTSSAPESSSDSVPAAITSVPATDAPVITAPVADVTAVLDDLAKHSQEKLDWRKSIVDLMKLVDMESSLSARKELAQELKYSGDMSDSAAMNVWLHREVIKQLAANGGKVPADLLD